jgi:hypothetical protein
MSRYARRVRAAVTLAALTLAGLAAVAPVAGASTASTAGKVPFTDTNVDGWLTFCTKSNQPMTSGSIYSVPFVWKAISSGKPPAGYATAGGRATLYAYQPIQYVDPGDWTGSQLTSASAYSNAAHPVAQATDADVPLIGFTQAYPAHWDGLIQIRLMYTSADKAQLTTPYAAAVIRITGSKWTLVEGGGGSCSASKGLSMETVALAKNKVDKPESAGMATKSPGTGAGNPGGSAGGSGSGGRTASDPTSGRPAPGSAGKLAADDSGSGISGIALAGVGVGAFALVWVGLTVVSRLRRRAAS